MIKRVVWVTLGLLIALSFGIYLKGSEGDFQRAFSLQLFLLVMSLIFYLPTFGFLWLVTFGLNRYVAVPVYVRSLLLLVGVLFFSAFFSWLTGNPFGTVLLPYQKASGISPLSPFFMACLVDAWLNYRYPPHAAKREIG